MRVTHRMIYEQANAQTQQARQRHQLAVEQASSGIRVSHPGDDPAAAGLIAKYRMAEARHDAIAKSVQRTDTELQGSDTALGALSNVLIRAKELAVQMSNATNNADDRAMAAVEVDELFKEAISLLNTEVAGRYVFGGAQDGAPPFTPQGQYVGDTHLRQVEIAPGVLSDTTIRADAMAVGTGGGVNLLTTLTDLATAMRSNNGQGIAGALPLLTQSLSQVATSRTQLGTLSNVMQTAANVARVAKDAQTSAISREGEIDPTEAFTELARAETSLQAALSAAAKSFQLGLIDKL